MRCDLRWVPAVKRCQDRCSSPDSPSSPSILPCTRIRSLQWASPASGGTTVVGILRILFLGKKSRCYPDSCRLNTSLQRKRTCRLNVQVKKCRHEKQPTAERCIWYSFKCETSCKEFNWMVSMRKEAEPDEQKETLWSRFLSFLK